MAIPASSTTSSNIVTAGCSASLCIIPLGLAVLLPHPQRDGVHRDAAEHGTNLLGSSPVRLRSGHGLPDLGADPSASGIRGVLSFPASRICIRSNQLSLWRRAVRVPSVRVAQLNHQQLLPQLFMIAALFALIRIFSSETVPPSRFQTRTWISVFVAASILHSTPRCISAGFCSWASARRSAPRFSSSVARPVLHVLRANMAWIVGCAAGAALVFTPRRTFLGRGNGGSGRRLCRDRADGPGMAAWTYLGTDNWLYGSLARVGPWNAVTESGYAHELSLGLGFVTTGIVVWSLVSERRNERLRVFRSQRS